MGSHIDYVTNFQEHICMQFIHVAPLISFNCCMLKAVQMVFQPAAAFACKFPCTNLKSLVGLDLVAQLTGRILPAISSHGIKHLQKTFTSTFNRALLGAVVLNARDSKLLSIKKFHFVDADNVAVMPQDSSPVKFGEAAVLDILWDCAARAQFLHLEKNNRWGANQAARFLCKFPFLYIRKSLVCTFSS